MKFMVDKVSLEQIFLLSFVGFPLLSIIPPLAHTHVSPPPEVWDSPEQAAHYHILGL
jgi:hypothetical protein